MLALRAPLSAWSPKSKTKHKSTANLPRSASPVHTNDTVSTGAKARLQVTFRDQTNLTLGENASVVIDRYVFDPDAGIGEAALNTTKGAFRLATGRLNEMTKKDITVSVAFRRDGRAWHRLLVGVRSRAVRCTPGAQQPARGTQRELHRGHRRRSQKVPLRRYPRPG